MRMHGCIKYNMNILVEVYHHKSVCGLLEYWHSADTSPLSKGREPMRCNKQISNKITPWSHMLEQEIATNLWSHGRFKICEPFIKLYRKVRKQGEKKKCFRSKFHWCHKTLVELNHSKNKTMSPSTKA